ncbi:hypothetical protein G6N82_00075 [Altererythrobacter sp. BO-6]|uniref:hypothetical protein n=1 Tax=Altererythrobacter sp. BO-6 TaxID=2604537 RepID=UPI0013E162D6|nr:hypothetical protein [Altererythrobacter sp. BO-6]QIG52769.1 hypothetical protein G6N82_00075 [Altererythrobacter sp. BO-6]
MEARLRHEVVYQFDGRATVAEVARSLLAQEKLLREAVAVLEECFDGLDISSVGVDIKLVAQESPLRTNLALFFAGVYSGEIGQDMPDILDTLFGLDVPDGYDSFVSLLVILVAIFGIDWLYKRMFPDKSGDKIEEEKDRLLAEAARMASLTEQQIEGAIDRALGKRERSVSKASMDFLQPARRHHASEVRSGSTILPKEVIDQIPSDIDLADYEPPSETEELRDVLIRFRAHDLDRNKKWAATIEEVSSERKPLHLAPDIQPDRLFNRNQVRGDVIVTTVRGPEGDYVPSLYYLEKIYD